MTTLSFADTHNLVAFLAKPAECEGFEQIVYFLNAHTIKYALTINPTIYTSCIEQFWATIKAKIVNREVQLQALVEGKKIIITEATIRRDLQLEDAEGIDCLPNATIFEELTRMGHEKLSQKLTFYKAFFYPQWKFLIHTILQCLSAKNTASNEFSSTVASIIIFFLDNQLEGMAPHDEIYIAPSHTKKIFANMRRSRKGFSGRETPLFPTMMVQAQAKMGEDNVADEAVNEEMDDSLKRVATTATSLDAEQDKGNITKTQSKATPNEPSSLGTSLGGGPMRQETIRDTIAQTRSGRVVSFDEASLGRYEDEDMFRVKDLDGDELVIESEAVIVTNVASTIPVSAATITNEQATTPIVSSQQPSQVKIHDKGKAKMIEPELVKKFSKKDQIKLNEELAFKLQAEEEEEERLAREKYEANVALIEEWNDIQAKIEADQLLAERLQAREQEELTIKERVKLFQQLLEKRRKFFTAKRAEEKRNRPPTRAQQRSIMSTYLKNMAGYKHNQLKNKSFKGSETRVEGSSKRVGDELKQESTKKQKMDDYKEIAELKSLMKIVPNEEKVAIDAIALATKPPSIVDYKIIKEGKINYFQIIRADGSSKRYYAFIQMLKSFDREDLETL
ncbi:hypothetical protein Tco_0859161 [Tanacetum coccineum]|uniref:Xylulose kinase-1 n=1 Tax=Tanacetum coccineum TaxID=301880 RepID=A0ABQ5BF58_9ASTR